MGIEINRREFMKRSAILTTLAAAGRLPLLGAESNYADEPAAVEPITGYLSDFTPAADKGVSLEDYALTYDIIHWAGANPLTRKTKNQAIGVLTVKRRKGEKGIDYEVNQRTNFGGLENIIEAQIACAEDELNTLRSWRMRTYGRDVSGAKVSLSEMSETGENKAGRIDVKDGNYRYGFAPSPPVVSQWSVLDFVAQRAEKSNSVSFDLLQDLSLFKPNQTLVFDGTVEASVKGGREVKLDSFAQTGEGILPIHYLLDAQRRPQLVTSSMVSWALRSIA